MSKRTYPEVVIEPLCITIPVEPQAKSVPKVKFVQSLGHNITYYTERTTEAMEAIRTYLMSLRLPMMPENVGLKLTVVFYRTPSGRVLHHRYKEPLPFRKPDTTNMVKLIEDCLNGIILKDDSQLTTVHSLKRWSNNDHGYITVRIEKDTEVVA